MKGLFITFEGGDGSGKSTLIQALFEELRRGGYDVLLTREPGGTPFAEKVRSLILVEGKEVSSKTELLLILAARNDHLEKVIFPSLERGTVVLCDRFVDSTVVYQGFAAGHDAEEVEALANEIIPHTPDCTFLLDLPLHESIKRRGERKGVVDDKMELKDSSFHEQVRVGFLAVAKKHPERIHILDARESVDTLFQKAMDIVLKKIREKQ
jgi:dTMP kinase